MSENPGQVVESVPQASTVPAIADAVPPPSPPSTKELEVIHKVLKIQQVGFYFWTVVYYGLGFLSIILPGVAAMGLYEGKVNQAFAGCGALAAALLGFLKAHELATGFDAAVQLAWITRTIVSLM
jgi:hypothetical protein